MFIRRIMLIVLLGTGCATPQQTPHTCKSGNITHCIAQGERLYENHSHQKALNSFERACALNDGYGCQWAGFLLYEGKGAHVDQRRGLQFYQTGCRLKNLGSCKRLAEHYRNTQRYDDAIDVYRKMCTHQSANGCWEHAELVRHQYGYKRALEIQSSLKRACKLGHNTSCEALKRPDVTYSKYERFLLKECNQKAGYACYLLAKHTERRWFKNGCALRHLLSCQAIGVPRSPKIKNRNPTDKKEVSAIFRTRSNQYSFCYEKVLRFENDVAAGKIVLSVTVQPDGTHSTKITKISPVISTMAECMVQTLESVSFPLPSNTYNKPYTVQKTFVFSTGTQKNNTDKGTSKKRLAP